MCLQVEPAKVSAKARFKEDLSLDSLDVVEVRAPLRGWWDRCVCMWPPVHGDGRQTDSRSLNHPFSLYRW